jgi:hypothetical protein
VRAVIFSLDSQLLVPSRTDEMDKVIKDLRIQKQSEVAALNR